MIFPPHIQKSVVFFSFRTPPVIPITIEISPRLRKGGTSLNCCCAFCNWPGVDSSVGTNTKQTGRSKLSHIARKR